MNGRSDHMQGSLLSTGALVKQDGKVLQELANNLKKPSNVCCRVEKFGNVVDGFCNVKRRWVEEMGFEGLLHLVGCRLPRSLCYWLATCVDCKKKELVVNGNRFPLSKVQVHWVYGLPYGPNAVPNRIKGKRMKQLEKEMWDYFVPSTGDGSRTITGQAIIDAVDLPAEDEALFKRAFLMLALNELICPTTCYKLSTKLIPAVLVYGDAKNYDWCSLLLDHLLVYMSRFAKTFDRQGYVAGCGGCTHFLAVMYLDRLRRSPMLWGVRPRVKVWNNREVNKALSEDRVANGDFGSVGCVDVAYGEAHPSEARDLFPQAVGADNSTAPEDRVAHRYYIPPSPKYIRKKRKKGTNGNPYLRKLNKKRREADAHQDCGEHQTPVTPPVPSTPDDDGFIPNIFHDRTSNHKYPSTQPTTLAGKTGNPEHHFNESPDPQDFGNNDVHVGPISESPNSRYVDRVVHGLFSEILDVEGEDGRTNHTPPYTWGSVSRRHHGFDDTEDSRDSCETAPQISYSFFDDSEVDEDAYIAVPLTPPPGFATPQNILSKPTEENCRIIDPPNSVDASTVYETPICNDRFVQRSRKQRVVRSSVKLTSEYIQNWRPLSYRGQKMKLAKVLMNSLSDPMFDPIVLECGGCSAALSSAAAVLSPAGRIDVQYVAAVAKLNTCVWAEKSRGRSKKLMFTPYFALNALSVVGTDVDCPSFWEQHAGELSSSEMAKINAIFIPVQEGPHWWAVAFSFNREEIRVLVPSGLDSEHLRPVVTKLQSALGALLHHVFPSWDLPDFATWKVVIPRYLQFAETIESGVAMLYSVKMCEDRFKASLSGILNYKQRAWLLCEDLMSKHNNVRDTVLALIR